MNPGQGLVSILLMSLLPGLGNALGVALAEWRQPGPKLTGAALHAAAGLATAVAAIELIPRAQDRIESWLIAIGVVVGAMVALGIARVTRKVSDKFSRGEQRTAIWGVYMVVGVDLLSDGLMTGSGGAVSASLGLLIALSQVVANMPGGFAVTANFRKAVVPRSQRLWMAAAYPIVPLVAAAAGYLFLREASERWTGFVLAILAGLLLVATIEDLVPEADEPGAPRKISSPAFAGGFVLLLLLSAYVGA